MKESAVYWICVIGYNLNAELRIIVLRLVIVSYFKLYGCFLGRPTSRVMLEGNTGILIYSSETTGA